MKDEIRKMELSLTNCNLLVEQMLMQNIQTQLNNEREINNIKMLQLQIEEIIKKLNCEVIEYDSNNTDSVKCNN